MSFLYEVPNHVEPNQTERLKTALQEVVDDINGKKPLQSAKDYIEEKRTAPRAKRNEYKQAACQRCGARFSTPAWRAALLCDSCWRESKRRAWKPGMKKAEQPGGGR